MSFARWARPTSPVHKAACYTLEGLERRMLLSVAPVDAGPLRFTADAWTQSGDVFSSSGTVSVGYVPAAGEQFTPLLQVSGPVSVTASLSNPTFQAAGEMDVVAVPGQVLPLWKGSATTFNVDDLTGSGGEALSDGQPMPVVGADFTGTHIRLNNPNGGSTADAQVLLQGAVSLSELIGARIGVTGINSVQIDADGVVLTGVDSSVTTPFTLHGLKVQPSMLSVAYTSAEELISFYGSAQVSTQDQFLNGTAVTLGTSSQPGLNVQHGNVTAVRFGLPNGMTAFHLQLHPGDLDFTWDQTNQQFEIYGSTTSDVDGSTLTLGMGDEQSPGMIIDKTGHVTQFTQSIDTSFHLFGIDLAPVKEGLTLGYNEDPLAPEYEISGTLGLVAVFGATVTLGTSTQPGLVIKDGQFQLDNFQITVGRIPLGGFSIGGLMLEWTTNDQGQREVGGKLSLAFPAGWSLTGELVFLDGKLDDISIEYHFTGTITPDNQPIYIGDTGLYISDITASVDNIAQPENLIVSGDLAVGWGDQIGWQGQTYTPLIVEGKVTVDRNELILEADAYFFAIRANNTTIGLGGSASAKLDLDWGDKQYSISGSLTQYDGLFEVDFDLSFDNSGDFTIIADAKVQVPKIVPFIGGKELAGLDFVFEMRKHDGTLDGFAAAWLELDIFHKFDVGVKVDIPSGHISVIGTDAVNAIEQGEHQPTPSTYTYYGSFTVPDGATAGTFQIAWPNAGGTQTVSVLPPGATKAIDQADFSTSNGLALVSKLSSSTSSAVHVVGDASNPDVNLPAGQYQVILTSNSKFDLSAVEFSGAFAYPKPTVALGQLPPNPDTTNKITVPLTGTVDDAFADNARVSVFVDTDNTGYDGVHLTDLPFTSSGMSVDWDLTGLLPAPSQYYLYAVINDGKNTPVKSEYSTPVSPVPPLSGIVTNANTSQAVSGWTVYLDTNANGTLDAGETSTTTGPTGFYDFFNIPANTPLGVGLVVPSGFQIHAGSDNPHHVTYDGSTPLNVDFAIDQFNAISGVVYDDVRADGKRDPGDVGLPGWTVFLDSNDNGTLDAGEVSTVSNASGTYEFLSLEAGASYTVRVLAQPDFFQTAPTPVPPGTNAVSFATTDQFRQVESQDFGVRPYPTVSGNITGHVFQDGELSPVGEFLEGWTVELRSGDTVVATTTTDADGNYLFANVSPGDYTIRQTVQSGWRQIGPFKSRPAFSDSFVSYGDATPVAVVTADFDGDGNQDVAFAYKGFATVSIFYGAGDGTFPAAEDSIITLDDPLKLVGLDFNGNGRSDLAVLDKNGQIDILINPGGRTRMTVQSNAFAWPTGLTPLDMAAGDFDGDKRDDLAVSYTGGANGAGWASLLSATRAVNRNDVLAVGGGIAVGDLNNDGKLDLLINGGEPHFFSTSEHDVFILAYGDGTGKFPQYGEQQSDHYTGSAAALSDLNGDGLLDVVVASNDNGYIEATIAFALQSGAGTTTPGSVVVYDGDNFFSPRLLVEDFDGDLKPDIAWIENISPRLRIALNQGGTRPFDMLKAVVFQILEPAGNTPADMAAADFNKDGLMDFVVVDPSRQGFNVLLNHAAITEDIPVVARADSTGNDFVNAERGQVSGVVFTDANANGTRDAADLGKADVRVYLDLDQNGAHDPETEPSTLTVAGGAYAFAGLEPGTYHLRVLRPDGHLLTAPDAGAHLATLLPDQPHSGQSHDFVLAVNDLPVIVDAGHSAMRQGRTTELWAEYTDQRALGESHSALVDWGDGTTSAASVVESDGRGRVTAGHVYRAGGVYDVTVWIIDGGDETVRVATTMTITVTGVGVHDGVLRIIGTEGKDRVKLTPAGKNRIRVHANFLPRGSARFHLDGVERIAMSLFSGNDKVSVAKSIDLPVWVNDTLFTGAKNKKGRK